MSKIPVWRAGFELEVILGDLGEPRFERGMLDDGPMDEASPAYCRAVAAALRERTGHAWSAPTSSRQRPGFYVVPEYGLDPLHWPMGRVAGVELLTPPLPLDEADAVRTEIIDAIEEIDGDFNFIPDEYTQDCGWHVNIDAGDALKLDPHRFIVGVDELLLLVRNDRLFTRYTGLQRHAVGVPLLRHLAQDPTAKFLQGASLGKLLNDRGGRDKGYAANFDKLLKGYIELRHFSADSFFNGPRLEQQLDRIPAALEVWFNQGGPFDDAFRRKFMVLSQWLAGIREKISWQLQPGIVVAQGHVQFADEPVGQIVADGLVELNLLGNAEYNYIATIRDIALPDIPEAVALLALDLAELSNLGIERAASPNKSFQGAVAQLANRLKGDPSLSSESQLVELMDAQSKRQETHLRWQPQASE